ncbi:MAG: ABC transporter permease [Actinomycetota bacterium]|nr:ABC transporter permease [Actinomycetota bacterium]
MSSMTATAPLTASALRRDRIVIPVWVYALAGTAIGTAYSFKHLYPTAADRLSFAEGVQTNAALLALTGRLYGTSLGGLVAWRLLGLGSAIVGLMSVLLIVRHTRADEEAERLELLRSAVVGRQAPLASALFTAFAANAAIAGVAALGLVAFGLPLTGSLLFGLAWFSAGITFAALAAVTAQLAETSRAANSMALSALAVAFLLRALGDASSPTGPRWLSWLSPIGWAQHTEPFGGQHWAVLLLPAGLTAAGVACAVAIQERRDLGAGAIAVRPGPVSAAGLLTGPFGLAWRLQRTALVGWSAGMALLGVTSGSIASSVGDLVGDSAASRTFIAQLGGPGSLVDAYLATIAGSVGLIVSGYAVSAAALLRKEESAGHAEILLAAPVSRLRWTASHASFALGGSAVLLAVAGLGVGVGYGLSTHDVSGQLLRLTGAVLVQLPAVWVVTGAAVALFAFVPRLTSAPWTVVGGCLLLGELGPTLRFPQWVLDVSPFSHVPKLPGADAAPLPLGILAGVAVVLLAAGAVRIRGRDLQG